MKVSAPRHKVSPENTLMLIVEDGFLGLLDAKVCLPFVANEVCHFFP